MNRREFLKSIGRYAILTGLFAGGGILLGRRKITPKPTQECINLGICKGCPVLDDCTLPLALSMKKVMRRL